MKLYLKLTILILSISFLSEIVKSDSVCSAQMLITELTQDILDNGKLDCLRKPLPAPKDRTESPISKKKRIEAAWDSDCAFEADYDWLKIAKDKFGLRSGLVDRDGKAIDRPFKDQADMCELIRAMVFGGIVEGTKLEALNEDSFINVECPGPNDQDLQICAATGGAASQKYSWIILLEASSITIKDSTEKPKWALEPKSQEKLDGRKNSIN